MEPHRRDIKEIYLNAKKNPAGEEQRDIPSRRKNVNSLGHGIGVCLVCGCDLMGKEENPIELQILGIGPGSWFWW